MRILALRAAAFKRFGAGVALEGLAPGLNLIAGPNELGKSTLFAALEAAFLLKYTATGSHVDALRPRGGGEPLVEADFFAGSQRWRIRKQFGRGKAAILTDLEAGRVVARAQEAEDRLSALMGGEGQGRAGLVWVRQQRALQPPNPDFDPAVGKSKSRGEENPLVALLAREVSGAAGSSEADAIKTMAQAALAELVTPGRDAVRKNGRYDQALKMRDDAHRAFERASAAAAASEARLEKIAVLTAGLATLDEPASRTCCERRIAMLERQLEEAHTLRSRRDVLFAELTAARAEALNARQVLETERMQERRIGELSAALETTHRLADELAALEAGLAGDTATPSLLEKLLAADNAIKIADAELNASAVSVEIALQPEGAGKVSAGGERLQASARLDVHETLDIAIPGIADIRVTTAEAERMAVVRMRRAQVEAELEKCWRAMGAASASDATSRAAARARNVEARDRARAQLNVLAPRGVAVLERQREEMRSASLGVSIGGLEGRIADIDAKGRLIRSDYDAALAAAPDDASFVKLSAELNAEREANAQGQRDLRQRSGDLERLRGEQAIVDEEGRAGEVERAKAALETAEAEVERLQREIAALKLLIQTLAHVTESVRGRYLEPVAGAIAPYLAELFPDAAMAFRDGFSLEAITRAGEREDFETLSDGTREQLAVLVRMGFARLLAERGASAPLILDDPLVYSDDARLSAMCSALVKASSQYQIVLMTCRETAFAALPAHHLEMVPWRPE